MNETDRSELDPQKLQAEARQAVEQAEDIREEIHDITLDALKEGRLDSERIKQVLDAVLKGASEGAAQHAARAKQALDQTTEGLDQALLKTANASRLAIEEAAGRLGEFSGQQLKGAFDDLKNMESLFVDALAKVSRGGRDASADIFKDLTFHARNSGTEIGRYVKASIGDMEAHLPSAAREALKAAAEGARDTSAQMAGIASAVLAGIADSLKKNNK